MLGTLRKGSSGFLAKTLMALLVASFAVWGIGDILKQNTSGQSVATVGDESISATEFMSEMESLRQSFGANFSPELLRGLNLYSVKLTEMINRRLIQLEAERVGIRIGDDELLAEIRKDSTFHNANGEFDKPLFMKTLQRSGINEKAYLDSLRMELAARILLGTLSIHPLTPKALTDTVYAAKHEMRNALLISITKPGDAERPAADDDALNAFYEAHKQRYVAPEYRTLHYIAINPDDIIKGVAVSRQELFDHYTQRTEEFLQPEQRNITQLLYEDKANAETAYSMLRSGKTLDETAEAAPPSGGKPLALGFKSKESMPAAGDEVFALDKGEFTYPVQSQFGWHIFYVTDIMPESVLPFDEVRDQLKEELTTQRANTALAETTEQLEDALSAGKALQEAAETLGLSYHASDPIDQTGRRADNSEALTGETEAEMLRRAFALESGERSELVSRPDGGYFIVEVDAITPARDRTFEEVRGQVAQDIAQYHQQNALQAYAKSAAEKLKNATGDKTETLASLTIESQHAVTLNRNGVKDKQQAEGQEEALPEALPEALLEELFGLRHSGDATQAYPYGKGYAIALLQDVIPAPSSIDSDEGKKLYKALRRSLREDYHNELLEQYLHNLHDRYPVSINQAAIDSLTKTE